METSVKLRIVSPLEKCFAKDCISDLAPLTVGSALWGERYFFQIAYTESVPSTFHKRDARLKIRSEIADKITVRYIENVPVRMPCYANINDDNYISKEPGLYPDLLLPMGENARVHVIPGELHSLMAEIRPDADIAAGYYPIIVSLEDEAGSPYAETCFTLEVIGAALPEQRMYFTQWFHCDSLASYYKVPIFSEEHWTIIENFVRTAADNGINMLLTPVFTPPLDTAIGSERPTVQLVDVTETADGYVFGFDRFDRFVKMAQGCGIRYFEISHLFTQWGAYHAPKIMVKGTDGAEYRKFGWDTDAQSPVYVTFLRSFITALLRHAETLGISDALFFHISDEPSASQLESYLAAKNSIADLLHDHVIMDALSNYEFYESGAVEHPIPSNDHVEPFIENNVPDLWTYYCCGQGVEVSNRFIAMPAARTRVIGEQFYKFRIAGFLQWGYNFYYTQGSTELINPYLVSDGSYWVPAGDTYSVYPAHDGTAYESLHMIAFTQALQDVRALELCESIYGRDTTLAAVENGLREPLTFKKYPRDGAYILNLRERINHMIGKRV